MYAARRCRGAFGADSFTCSLALGMARKGVTLDAVCPAGYTETDMLRRSINMVARTGRNVGDERASFAAANPQGRIVQSAQVAGTVLWPCPPGVGITGQSTSVSGGQAT